LQFFCKVKYSKNFSCCHITGSNDNAYFRPTLTLHRDLIAFRAFDFFTKNLGNVTYIYNSVQYLSVNCLFLLANLGEEVIEKAATELETGIYFGWASVDNGPVYKMVMLFGFVPFFKHPTRSMVCISSCLFGSLTLRRPPLFMRFCQFWSAR